MNAWSTEGAEPDRDHGRCCTRTAPRATLHDRSPSPHVPKRQLRPNSPSKASKPEATLQAASVFRRVRLFRPCGGVLECEGVSVSACAESGSRCGYDGKVSVSQHVLKCLVSGCVRCVLGGLYASVSELVRGLVAACAEISGSVRFSQQGNLYKP